MTKHKTTKELLKAIGISALAIAMFSAAFLGINTFAFTSSTGEAESLSLELEPVAIPETQAPAEDFVEPEVTLSVRESQSRPCGNAMSPEDAAMAAAQYIWEVFGESIDGDIVNLWYSAHPSSTRTWWMGSVNIPATETMETPGRDASTEEIMRYRRLNADTWRFNFTIDAVTGEWIDIIRALGMPSTEASLALGEISEEERISIFRAAEAPPKELGEYAQIAKEHAARHFINTEVIGAEFSSIGGSGFDLDENGKLIVTSRQIIFDVTDNTGRVANVSFDEESGELFYISTQQNDIVPGFSEQWENDGIG